MRIFRNGSSFFIIIIGLIGIFVFAPQVFHSLSKAQRSAVGWYKEPRLVEYTLESLDSIEVTTTSLDISVVASDSTAGITVSYYANWDGHINDNHSSSLKIEENWKQNWLYVFLPKIDHLVNRDSYASLEITVPRETNLAKLKVTTKNGKIEITGINANDVSITATNQSVMVSKCDFNETNIANVSGSTTIKNSSLGRRGKISHTGGKLSLSNSAIGDDFRIKGSCALTNSYLGNDVKIENANGNIQIDGIEFDGITILSTSGNITVSNIVAIDLCSFNLKASSGAIKVNGTNHGTIYNVKPNSWQTWLKISATSGNITIN